VAITGSRPINNEKLAARVANVIAIAGLRLRTAAPGYRVTSRTVISRGSAVTSGDERNRFVDFSRRFSWELMRCTYVSRSFDCPGFLRARARIVTLVNKSPFASSPPPAPPLAAPFFTRLFYAALGDAAFLTNPISLGTATKSFY
jgi:hypothetical protein